ncbi:NADP-dependent aldehyde dehydrogenase [Nocardiopsis sp. Huas11]|uniref:aldehyde dehydrogenase (NADP(+)) n=1 Tax=Nocardiopsis sp. Huas11 TaxID=2183912 RepID=UPI000EAF9F59|nr:aldehyde dehydrogenase (NADP(+)) [Nocardiopsis sp. Huas11]RKS07280.1 NADP-dependent aldehyde dehydrogenase [Nocardiopsis sp. Huas11]
MHHHTDGPAAPAASAPAAPADSTAADVAAALEAAAGAAPALADLLPRERADLLRRVADAVDADTDALVGLAAEETHLPEARLRGEVGRTTFQLRRFAAVLDEGAYLEAVVDTADPAWPVGPRPDLRRVLEPLGPVVVFGASNFPFAFSVLGGDTASALAAGCPVVVKAHPGHPRLSARTGAIADRALRAAGAPEGTFALLFGEEAGRLAVTHPAARAVGFTGSIRGGRALHDLAAARPEPIPFYGELGSVNPVFVTRAAAEARAAEILSGFAGSFTLGAGQFCTKPGLLFLPASVSLEPLVDAVRASAPAALLNERVAAGFGGGVAALTGHPATTVLVEGTVDGDGAASAGWAPTLAATTVTDLLAHADVLMEECFGPAALVVSYADESELLPVAEALPGQLTATVHAEDTPQERPFAAALTARLRDRAGRLLWNGWPTGVSVTDAMHHGGPYPASTSALHTSVGATAIRRFLRPVTYQDMPHHLLPPALRDDNPLGIPRRVDGAAEPA